MTAEDGTVSYETTKFNYTINEVVGREKGYAYDGHEVKVTVTVSDNGDGTLKADVAFEGSTEFKNEYKEITIKAGDGEWKYDGKDHSNPKVTITDGALKSGDTLVAEAVGSVKNVKDSAEGNNTIPEGSYKIMRGEEDVTEEYKVTTVAGTLKITPREVNMFSQNDTKYYPQVAKNTNVVVTGDGFVSGEGVTYSNFASRGSIGTQPNTFTYALNEGTLAENYKITQTYGTLRVQWRPDPPVPPTPPVPVPGGPAGDNLIVIDDFETPLGLGGVYINVGECFE